MCEYVYFLGGGGEEGGAFIIFFVFQCLVNAVEPICMQMTAC